MSVARVVAPKHRRGSDHPCSCSTPIRRHRGRGGAFGSGKDCSRVGGVPRRTALCDSPNRGGIIGTSLDESKCRARPLAPLAAGSLRERSALGRVRPRARTAGATHPDPRTKPGTPAAEHRGFVGEVESCAHEAPGLGRKALSFARKAKSLAHAPKRFAHKALSLASKVKSLAHAPKRFVHKALELCAQGKKPCARPEKPCGQGSGPCPRGSRASLPGKKPGARGSEARPRGSEGWGRGGRPRGRRSGPRSGGLAPRRARSPEGG